MRKLRNISIAAVLLVSALTQMSGAGHAAFTFDDPAGPDQSTGPTSGTIFEPTK
jgi:hypothetical protein